MAETAAEALRDAIITGKLKPGDRLVEQKLAADLGIGQPTLREALKELEYQGFVRKVPKKGTHVTKLTKEDFRKISQVRLSLEVLAIEQAAANMTGSADRELEVLVDTMAGSALELDLAKFHKSDVAFHQIIWKLADNEYLELALNRLVFALFAFVLLLREGESRAESFRASAEQHRQILEGLRTRDARLAREKFIRSTLHFWNTYYQVGLTTNTYMG